MQAPNPWHWEGNVQAALARWLESQGWTITSLADTASRATGVDLLASRDDELLAVEVKGYPTTTYARGPNAGLPKPTQPANQARQWYSHALLSVMLLRQQHPNSLVAMCFADFPTFRSLIQRTDDSLISLGVGVYLVRDDGGVDVPLAPRAPTD